MNDSIFTYINLNDTGIITSSYSSQKDKLLKECNEVSNQLNSLTEQLIITVKILIPRCDCELRDIRN